MFFKTIAYRQEIWGQAMRKAAKERKGWNYASQLVKKHGDDPLNSPLGKDIEFDANGNLWVANTYVTNKNLPIHVRNTNYEWKSYGSSETSVKISQSPI